MRFYHTIIVLIILIHTSVKLVTNQSSRLGYNCNILIHTSVKLVTFAVPHTCPRAVILIHTSVKLVTYCSQSGSNGILF